MPHPKPSELGTSTVQVYSEPCLGSQYTFRGFPDLWVLGLATMPDPCWQTYQTHVTWVRHPSKLGLTCLSDPSKYGSDATFQL